MAYYSFVAIAKQPVGFTKPMLMLDAGVNVFSVVVDDVQALLEAFKDEGVTVQQMNQLDAHEAPPLEADILPDEMPQLPGGLDGFES